MNGKNHPVQEQDSVEQTRALQKLAARSPKNNRMIRHLQRGEKVYSIEVEDVIYGLDTRAEAELLCTETMAAIHKLQEYIAGYEDMHRKLTDSKWWLPPVWPNFPVSLVTWFNCEYYVEDHQHFIQAINNPEQELSYGHFFAHIPVAIWNQLCEHFGRPNDGYLTPDREEIRKMITDLLGADRYAALSKEVE